MNSMITATGKTLNGLSLIAPPVAGTIAFRLFCTTRARGKIRPAERATHDQAITDTVTVGGNRVVTYQWGRGEKPVLMIHGLQSRGSRFAFLAEKLLSHGYTPVTFDAPGHGDSEGKGTTVLEYLAIARHLQDKHGPFHAIVANSLGAAGMFHAVRSGVSAQRLVSVSGLAEFSFLVDEFSRQLTLRPQLTAQLRSRLEKLLAPTVDVWTEFSAPYRSKSITQPLLVIHDTEDEVIPYRHAQIIAEAYPDTATQVTTNGLGHRRVLNNEDVVDTVTRFVTQQPATIS